MVTRLAVGNVSPRRLAELLAAEGLAGTVVPAVGFTPAWGIERSALAILAGVGYGELRDPVRRILATLGEAAAYLDDGESAWLLYGDRAELLSA